MKASIGITMIPHDSEIEQPLGVVRINKPLTENVSVECEHISSIEQGLSVSFDHCGFFYNF